MNNFEILCKVIFQNSKEQKNFNIAKFEWDYVGMEKIPDSICACSHYPITDCCYIFNNLTKQSVMVGNCCIKHFDNIESLDWYFQGVNRIFKFETPNKKTIEHLYSENIINEFEYKFLISIHGKKNYTEKQRGYKYNLLSRLKQKLFKQ